MEQKALKLADIINDFFGSDAMYYGVDSYALAWHLIDAGVTVE